MKKRIVIIGGVAGGASAAARARRLSEEAEIVLIERSDHISFANCGLPYHIGETIVDREKLLVQTPKQMKTRFRIDVRVRCEATKVDPRKKTVTVRSLDEGTEEVLSYDALVLSPGAYPKRPPLPGIDLPGVKTLRNIADMDAIKAVVDAGGVSRAVVVGGGYIGLEMVEALRHRDIPTTLVEQEDQVFILADREMVAPVHQQLQLHCVDLRLKTTVRAIEQEGEGLAVVLSSGGRIAAELVIMSIGVQPETWLARDAGLKLGETGGILVDEHQRTSDPDIYAVGDAAEVTHFVSGTKCLVPLAGPANRQGRIAADNIFGRDSTYTASQGTAICKVFDLAIGLTGLSETALKGAGIDYEAVHVHPMSHAGYYPDAKPLSLKLLFSPKDGRILGAQAVGGDGVDKRIDVIAVAMRAGLTVEALSELELSYAPPYGSAKDPVNYAGFAAQNILDGDVSVIHTDEINRPTEDQFLLDVRMPAEVEAGIIPGATVIPLDELRERLDDIPKDREVLAYCQVGLRGYLAARILTQNGYRCRNLSGGYKTWTGATADPSKAAPIATTSSGCCGAPAETASAAGGCACSETAGEEDEETMTIVERVDATALQCPGPIIRLREAVERLAPGESVEIRTADGGFASDVAAWCRCTKNRLEGVNACDGVYTAVVTKGSGGNGRSGGAPAAASTLEEIEALKKQKTMVVFSGDLDKALAAFIIANGAAAMGSTVTLFFTFWGLNVLRRSEHVPVKKNLIEQMFGWMMPRGATRLKLSQMNMGGMGAAMIKGIMRKKNVASLPDLIESAQAAGVRLVACSMSMDLMGIHREELIDGVEEGGVAMFLDQAENGTVNMFI